MTNPPKPSSGSRTGLLIALAAILILLIFWLVRSCRAQDRAARVAEETPVVPEVTVTLIPPAGPTATPRPAPTPTSPPVACQDSVVLIGPDAGTVRPETVCVGPSNWVRWTAWDNQSPLTIYFPTSGFPNGISQNVAPFPDMTRRTGGGKDDWVFNHPQKSTTYAERPNSIGSPNGRYVFKYDQELNGVRKDARIIIQR